MRQIVESIEGEFRRYKGLAEGAISQLSESQLQSRTGESNSVAIIMWHVGGNLKSRFTDFLTSDGEKTWRDRESEFAERRVPRQELLAKWEEGWQALFSALAPLSDEQREQQVTIRGVPHSILEALHRSLSHVSYHVGQIVFIAHSLRGAEWRYLTIPPGKSADYNKDPKFDKPKR
ncbi:MAG TPA: DUF1572 family protein [Thermoanaerobaculia bacterium]|nr:DUF1572 family protein [Thermoanaerobaculia bacterium]